MSKRPHTWMPFYIGDYLADTLHLSRDQHGGYMLLIIAYWRNGAPLEDDDGYLAAITKASINEWKRLRPAMARFFTVRDGHWHHKRIDAELTTMAAKYEQKINAGIASAAAKAQRKANECSTTVDSPLEREVNQSQSQSSLRSEEIDEDKSSSCSKAKLTDRELGREFDEFWPVYPRRVGKQGALAEYRLVRRRGASAEEIKDGARRYAERRRDKDEQFTAHPKTWLHNGRWADEASNAVNSSAPDRPDGPPPPLSERELKYLETGILQ